MQSGMELHILEHKVYLISVEKEAIPIVTHSLVKLALLYKHTNCRFFSYTETCDDFSVIVDEDGFQEIPKHEKVKVQPDRWRVLNVAVGAYATNKVSGLTKIAKSVILPLADYHVSVFCMSTYQTDFILVKENDMEKAIECLSANFKVFQEKDGETMPVPINHPVDEDKLQDPAGIENIRFFNVVTNEIRGTPRPIVHPFCVPLNRFSIRSLNPETLPNVACALLEIMFYAESLISPLQDGHDRFFSYSVVDGEISLVMDADALAKFPTNSLFGSTAGECWRMIRIGGAPLGFDECGIAAQISQPLADTDISTYYISTFLTDHTLVPEEDADHVIQILKSRQQLQPIREENDDGPQHINTMNSVNSTDDSDEKLPVRHQNDKDVAYY
ncbi:cytosolic arginine sensor for mTORC1 subunit 2-like isoform X1 [Ptychodera flava]|uniref:cytosolic arginine sensor for mTORC1 subunit 2-like isoform X1 n=1 Tax=Ptychodera flava TaxID=63121 RepID=UPI00396A08E4